MNIASLDLLSLDDQPMADVDADICDRCSVICRKPEELSARWKFLFKIDKKPGDLASLRCEICRFFEEVMLEHERLSNIKPLPPAYIAIRRQSDTASSMACQLRLTYKLSTRHHMYYAKITHIAPSTERPSPVRTHPASIPYEKIKLWVRDCQNHDPYQLASEEHVRGIKVIDCEVEPHRLVEAPEPYDYIALSYVWGDSQEASFRTGDTLSEDLPQTIKDSITVTRRLGFKYLWVDRYCIDQQNKSDKIHQISQMGAIYAHARLTLFAVLGNDPSHGLPGVGIGRRLPFSDASAGRLHLRHEWDSIDDIIRSRWASRGWTLQESYLSTKRLFFTERQVVFACNSEIICEHTPMAEKARRLKGILGPGFDKSSVQDPALILTTVMETYSERQIRRHDDAFNAISGILNSLTGPENRYAHLWGVPFDRTDVRSVPPSIVRRHANLLWLSWSTRKQGHRRMNLPSWSPLGWSGHIEYHRSQGTSVKVWTGSMWSLLVTTASMTENMRINPPPISRFLKVTASTFHLKLSRRVLMDSRSSEIHESLCCTGLDDYVFDPHWDSAARDVESVENILCMISRDATFLLLLRTWHALPSDVSAINPQNLPVYERVGSIDLLSANRHYTESESMMGPSLCAVNLKNLGSDTQLGRRLKELVDTQILHEPSDQAQSDSLRAKLETFILA